MSDLQPLGEREPKLSAPVRWVAAEPTCYACLGPATHEIQHGNVWLNVCDDPACRGVGE